MLSAYTTEQCAMHYCNKMIPSVKLLVKQSVLDKSVHKPQQDTVMLADNAKILKDIMLSTLDGIQLTSC